MTSERNTKYLPPPQGTDGLIPVHQISLYTPLKDHLLYLKGVADAAGYISLSEELMRNICDINRQLENQVDRLKIQLEKEKHKSAILLKKTKVNANK